MKKMKRILILCLAMCMLCFCAVGCSVKDYFERIDSELNDYINDTETSSTENSSDKMKTSDNNSEDIEDDTPGLTSPDNVLEYVTLDLTLKKDVEPRFDSCTKESGAVRSKFLFSNDLKNEINNNENKSFAVLTYPLSYFNSVNPNNYTYMDWITEFDTAGLDEYSLSVYDISSVEDTNSDGYCEFWYYLYGIPYKGINDELVSIGVLITTDSNGNETYKYSTFESGNYRTNAYSLAGVAAKSLSKYALGQASYTAEQVELLKTYVNWSVDKANGLTEPTDDNSTYTVSVSPTELTLNVGETSNINVDVAEIDNIPVSYISLAESVVTVTDKGKIKGIAVGTTVIAVYVAGVSYTVKVTVS